VKTFNIKTNDEGLEFAYSEGNKGWELCKWMDNGSYNLVIAFFDRDSEGYNMRTVGNRFFEHEGAFKAAMRAMRMLEVIHEMEEQA